MVRLSSMWGRSVVRGSSVVLLLMCSALPLHAADDGARAYVLHEQELARLLASNVAPGRVQQLPHADPRWDAVAHYAITSPEGAALDVYVSASVLDAIPSAQTFFRDSVRYMEADNERARVEGQPGEAASFGVDELLRFQLVYIDHDTGRRVSNYARQVRLGRAVALVEAIGSPEADDHGVVDNDRGIVLARTFELVLGKMLWDPVDQATSIPGFSAFATDWGRHGFALVVDSTGRGQASWRVYTWCTSNPRSPCDAMVGNQITPGGGGAVIFYGVDGQRANGVVIGSNDDDLLHLGPVSLSLQPDGLAQLEQGDQQLQLCGPDYERLASQAVRSTMPCGT